MQKTLIFFVSLVVFTYSFAQDSLLQRLKMDTTFAFLQYKNPALIESLQRQLNNSDSDKFVIYHFGGSHIQAGMPPNVARKYLQDRYGDGGPGMIFSYKAADTYSSVNYKSTKTGNWIFGKSFQGNPKVPLGVCGMGVETNSKSASLGFQFKQTICKAEYFLHVFVESDTLNHPFQLKINDQVYPQSQLQEIKPGSWQLAVSGSIDSISVAIFADSTNANKRFRFYGIDIERQANTGVVYHSLGVGAAAFRSVLQLEKLTDHSKVLLPDMVFLDFGTNDILYTNTIDKKLPATVEKAIAQFRAINPNILIVLTSTQDLYKNGKYITAGVEFVQLMDSLAQKNDCFFWNWYDLAGGYGTINTWKQEKYAKPDGIHLTADGYAVKGEWLFRSFQNSLQFGQAYPEASCLIPMKGFPVKAAIDTVQVPVVQPIQRSPAVERQRYYTVRSGDTLGEIAQKHGVSVSALKRANGLRSDVLQIGKRLKIPK